MSWVSEEQPPNECHLQSAQGPLWCVNYSINQQVSVSGCQHLNTSETLHVNGACDVSTTQVCTCVDDRPHITLLLQFLYLKKKKKDFHLEQNMCANIE